MINITESPRQIVNIEKEIVEQTKVDTVSNAEIYYGFAQCGRLSSEAAWKIERKVVVGTEATIQWADGDGNYDNVWDNRTSLTYK